MILFMHRQLYDWKRHFMYLRSGGMMLYVSCVSKGDYVCKMN